MEKIVIIGGGGHAKVLISIIQKIKKYEIIGYVDKSNKGTLSHVPYLGDDFALDPIIQHDKNCKAVLGIGTIGTGDIRKIIFENVKNIGFTFASIISSDAIVNSGTYIDEGVVVVDGAVINTGTHIGRGCIINSNSTVDHDCEIGEFVHIAPGSVLCGNVTIKPLSLVGAGSIIIQGASVSDGCIIGAGSVVIKSIEESGTYAGNPARRVM